MSYGIPLAKQLFNLKVRYSYHGPAAQYFQLRSRISINEYRAGCSRTLTTAMVLYYVCFYINAYCKYCIFSTKIRFFLEQRTSEKQGVFYMLANLVNSRNKNEVSFSINTQVLSSMLIAIIHCCSGQNLEIQQFCMPFNMFRAAVNVYVCDQLNHHNLHSVSGYRYVHKNGTTLSHAVVNWVEKPSNGVPQRHWAVLAQFNCTNSTTVANASMANEFSRNSLVIDLTGPVMLQLSHCTNSSH